MVARIYQNKLKSLYFQCGPIGKKMYQKRLKYGNIKVILSKINGLFGSDNQLFNLIFYHFNKN